MQARSCVIRNGRLLDVEAHAAPLRDLLVVDGIIRDIGPPGLAAPEGLPDVDADDHLLMPGFVNGHTHGHGALGKGAVPDRAHLELFLTLIPSLGGSQGIEHKRLAARLSACELLRKGCTTCMDLFAEFPTPTVDGIHAVAEGYADAGMRAVIAPMLADRTLYEAIPGLMDALPEAQREAVSRLQMAPYEQTLRTVATLLRDWPFDRDYLQPAVAPTIPMHCSDDFLRGCDRLARDHGALLQTHLAESKTQAIQGRKRYGKTLTAHLDKLGMLGKHVSAAHGIWLDDDDMRRLAAAGVSVIHNPLSNLRLGSGLAPIRRLLDAGVNVGLGSDAANTSDSQNMFEVTRLAAYLSRIQQADHARWLASDEVLDLATRGSAAAMGLDDRLGAIRVGACADIVFLSLDHVDYWPLRDPVMQVVNTESGAAVDHVMVGGRLVVENGHVTTLDESRLRRDVEAAAAALDVANADNRAFALGLHRYIGAFCVANLCDHYAVDRRADHVGAD